MKKFLAVVLSVFLLTACQPQTAPDAPVSDVPTQSPAPSGKVTRSTLYEPVDADEFFIDICHTGEIIYVLTNKDILAFTGKQLTARWPIADESDMMTGTALTVADNAIYVLCQNVFTETYLKKYNLDGECVQTYEGVMQYGKGYGLAVVNGVAYIPIYAHDESRFLCVYDLEADKAAKRNTAIYRPTPYKDGLLLCDEFGKLGVYDIANDVFESFPPGQAIVYDSAYHAASGDVLMLERPNENTSNYYISRYTPGDAPIDDADILLPIMYSFTHVWDGAGMAFSISGDSMAVTERDKISLYENIDGEWPEVRAPLRVLGIQDMTRSNMGLTPDWYKNIEEEAIGELYDRYGFILPPVEYTEIIADRERIKNGEITLESYWEGTEYDLVYISSHCLRFMHTDGGLYDLSTYAPIDVQFSDMLPGVRELCSVNGKPIGVPIGLYVNMNDWNGIAEEISERLPFDWTFADLLQCLQSDFSNKKLKFYEQDFFHLPTGQMLAEAAAGILPERAALEDFLTTFKAIYDGGYTTSVMSSMGFFGDFGCFAPCSLYAPHDTNMARPFILAPRYAASVRPAHDISIMAALPQSERLEEVLQFLECWIDKDVQYMAIDGAWYKDWPMTNVWYKYDDIWEIPFMQNHEMVLANGIRFRIPIIDDEYVPIEGILEAYAAGAMDLAETADTLLRELERIRAE